MKREVPPEGLHSWVSNIIIVIMMTIMMFSDDDGDEDDDEEEDKLIRIPRILAMRTNLFCQKNHIDNVPFHQRETYL